ncbi:hypothetical protein OFM04_35250, partial [Escherichia coli]|nr:hypothetical protein [Escherichia coli]
IDPQGYSVEVESVVVLHEIHSAVLDIGRPQCSIGAKHELVALSGTAQDQMIEYGRRGEVKRLF